MSHRRRGDRLRRGAAEILDEELQEKVTPEMWAKAGTDKATRIRILDAVLDIVGQQLRIWIADKRRREE